MQIRNTSDKKDFNLEQDLKSAFQAKGFKVVTKQDQAQYVLQMNILQVGKSSPSAAEAAMCKGYGYDGMAIGSGVAYMVGGSSEAIVGAGLLGGLASIVADSAVKDVYYSVITDLQIKEKARPGQKINHSTSHFNQSGTSGGTTASYQEKSNWKIYQTRILSSANKVNLDLNEALPAFKQGISQSVVGLF